MMAAARISQEWSLPPVRGKLRAEAVLRDSNWFRVGGPADWLFKPADAQDLADFIRQRPSDVPVTVLGVGSNVIVRDGGIPGVVVRLGRGFVAMTSEKQADGSAIVTCGAGALGRNLAHWCEGEGLAGLEFLSGIPGTVGGAVAMNAGAYGAEVADRFVDCGVVTADGHMHTLSADALAMSYRRGNLPEGSIVYEARFRCHRDQPENIARRIADIQSSREATQPIRERTGGSTFKNPVGQKAWQLVDQAGGRGLRVGGAQISEKHCNFMINTGDATAADLENLGETVRRRVQEASGVELQWEIKRVGRQTS